MTGQRWRYDARTMAKNPHLCPEFVEPDPRNGFYEDDETPEHITAIFNHGPHGVTSREAA